ncbi:MAG: ABC transporter ATP-binding protein [Candidatus Nomurabacteria bacterium]|nr:ABC transporter ATP-binding protein [Candidatus Nomurabacteria bacterium]
MNDEIAISAKSIFKDFYLPHEKNDSIKSKIVNAYKKKDRGADTQHALKGISFDIKKGEFFGVVGRNGSGKSTLLKILAQIYRPTSGTVEVRGRLVPFIELGVGFNPDLTGSDNVYLNGALLGFSRREVDAKYQRIVEFAELEEFMSQKLKNYSSGMQVRLAFSVATVLAESDILLVDEVLAVGDADFQRKCLEYFKELKKLKKTVVFVSHSMDAIREFCDRAILIDEGRVAIEDTAQNVAKEYSKLFIKDTNRTKQRQERWGKGGAKYNKVSLAKTTITNDDTVITLYAEVESVNVDGEVIVGFMIKNGADAMVCGTNSAIVNQNINVEIRKGCVANIEWSIPNIFSDGKYTIDVAIATSTGETLEWWSNSTEFDVFNYQSTPYIVSPKFNLKYKAASRRSGKRNRN